VYLYFDVTIPASAKGAELSILSYTVTSDNDPSAYAEGETALTGDFPSDVDDGYAANLPDRVSLGQNYPNPFNPTTTIAFSLPEASRVSLEVIDILGRRADALDLGVMSAGSHGIEYDASALASGVYFYRLITEYSSHTKKMMVLK